LWETGRCSFRGKYFAVEDALSLPVPPGHVPIVNAGMSPRGLEFSARFADLSFVMVGDEDTARLFASTLREKAQERTLESEVKMAAVFTVVAADTDEQAHALVEHIRVGVDIDAMAEMIRRGTGAGDSPAATLENVRRRTFQLALLVGSPGSVAAQMKGYAAAGVDAFLLTFPDFVADLEYFGQNVVPLLERV
jgi:pyrimidine oxygenase